MSDAGGKKFSFTCPECFVSLTARVSQTGARLTCPSCSASITVPDVPATRSIAGQTERTIDSSAAEAAGGYDLATPTRSASEDSRHPISKPPRSTSDNTGYNVQGSQTTPQKTTDLITVTCHVCTTRISTNRKNLGKKLRCTECGTVVPIAETPKSPEQMRKPDKIDEASVGEYGVDDREQAGTARETVTIPFNCRLCDTLLRGTGTQVGKELTCPDCGTKTIVPPLKKVSPKAFVGAASGVDLSEYGLSEPNVSTGNEVPVVCSLCSSRLMARPDQVGAKIRCPDCGQETLVKAPAPETTGTVMGSLAQGNDAGADYDVRTPAAEREPEELILDCSTCGQRMSTSTAYVGQEVACPNCRTVTRVPEQKQPAPKPAAPTEQVVRVAEEYAVTGPQEIVEKTPMAVGGIKEKPAEDPDFDFLDEIDNSKMTWWVRDRSDKFGFLGHPDAFGRWIGFSLGGVCGFTCVAVSLILYAIPRAGLMTGTVWFSAGMSLAVGGLICLPWAAMFSVNLLAILQDTSAGNRIVQGWPDGDWMEQIGESFYVFNSCMVSFIPVTVLLQTWPPARPFAPLLYLAGFWLTLPVALLSMLETGSVLSPVSGNVAWSLLRRPGAWGWFYLRSLVLIVLTLAVYLGLWLYVCGPIALPLLIPMTTALAMVYARWLGILGASVSEVIEELGEGTEEGDE